ncbi:hypothetical protein P153DRAFT_82690 [Dothidotthia symphoricarpi CBS 119687]|uniref:Zinc-binding domain-containing protein n=1 Tax=Dothidotthia symphoricarpi CBS 119687 TaxID=1392245 RepID=A0A6A6A2E4_9PLEO|nr:uncharacterized protein P153DRAFT_82690 [Dothidotthia symphoricarpi CBS 119687]KAF2125970.1 hypothetical protein P153DRAFT_82690 [Dothidotthia symphoricarpi CBS 119687]
MAKKKKKKTKGNIETRISFMYPMPHQIVVDAISDEVLLAWLQEDEDNDNVNNNYLITVKACFSYLNNACNQWGWSSRRIAIKKRGYYKNRHNNVVINQHCKLCSQL